jgi:hypothetical protein
MIHSGGGVSQDDRMSHIARAETAAKVLRAEIEAGIYCDADWLTITEKVLEVYGIGPSMPERTRGGGVEERDEFRKAARALRQACHDANGPVVPAPVAEAIARVTALGDSNP